MNISPNKILFALALSAAITIAGCKSSTEPTSAPSWKTPGVGSTYTLVINYYDSSRSGPNLDTSSVSYVVVANGLSVGGKTNATRFQTPAGTGGGYTVIEPNGDFLMSDSGSTGFLWTVFPTGNHGSITVRSVDSTDADGYHYKASDVRSYDGTERIATSAGTFDAIRIKDVLTSSQTPPNGQGYSSSATEYMWIAPSIGFIAKLSSDGSYLSSTGERDVYRSRGELTQVTVK